MDASHSLSEGAEGSPRHPGAPPTAPGWGQPPPPPPGGGEGPGRGDSTKPPFRPSGLRGWGGGLILAAPPAIVPKVLTRRILIPRAPVIAQIIAPIIAPILAPIIGPIIPPIAGAPPGGGSQCCDASDGVGCRIVRTHKSTGWLRSPDPPQWIPGRRNLGGGISTPDGGPGRIVAPIIAPITAPLKLTRWTDGLVSLG